MIGGTFDSIDAESLNRLQAGGVAESRTLDYKEKLPGS